MMPEKLLILRESRRANGARRKMRNLLDRVLSSTPRNVSARISSWSRFKEASDGNGGAANRFPQKFSLKRLCLAPMATAQRGQVSSSRVSLPPLLFLEFRASSGSPFTAWQPPREGEVTLGFRNLTGTIHQEPSPPSSLCPV